MDLRSVGGSANGNIVGGIVQELEVPSGNVLFEWHSLDHVSLEESYSDFQHQYDYFDYFHGNPVAPPRTGTCSSRRIHLDGYKIDRGSGEVIWRLGGKKE